jgi:diaminopropionate ammonia-lyase
VCPAPSSARQFHRLLPGYAPTPLVEVPALARDLRAGRVFVKDESSRLGLAAFKVLGASWAIHQIIGTGAAGRGDGLGTPMSLAGLRARAASWPGLVFVTATDGNHGLAVARMAGLVGAAARVFVPAVMRPAARAAIAAEGAEVTPVAGSYDQAVAAAARWAAGHRAARLVQDTAWPGYEQVPAWIVTGYSTLFEELDDQLHQAGAWPATLIAVPVGVGSLAQAAVAHYRGSGAAPRPALLAVEPGTAACALASLQAHQPVAVPTGDTVMAGLNCGTVSATAWPYLAAGLDAAVAVTDKMARRAMHDLAAAGIWAGPSGAASLAGTRAALTGPGSRRRRAQVGAGRAATVVLLSTEGGRRPDGG